MTRAIFLSLDGPGTFHSWGFCICSSIYLEHSASDLLSGFGLNSISSERASLFSPLPTSAIIPLQPLCHIKLLHFLHSNNDFLKVYCLFTCLLFSHTGYKFRNGKDFHESSSFLLTTVSQSVEQQPASSSGQLGSVII